MPVVWDEPKRTGLARRGMDLANFLSAATIIPAKSGRHAATGALTDGTITTIFATLGTEAVSIVSMRRASRKERTRHAQEVRS